jgi:hypothetical protein
VRSRLHRQLENENLASGPGKSEMKSSTEQQGWILLYRQLMRDWKGQHPMCRSAWTWILLNAEWNPKGFKGLQRGQVRFSVDQAQKLWGMSPTAARRFLAACVKDGSISWEKGKPGRPTTKRISENNSRHGGISGGISGGNSGGISGIITVLKYDEYQIMPEIVGGISGGNTKTFHGLIKGSKSAPDTADEGLSKESTKESTNKRRVLVADAPASPGKKSSRKASKDSDPGISQLTDYYCTGFQTKYSRKYPFNKGKDNGIIQGLVTEYPLEDLKACIDLHWENEDDLIKKNGHTIGMLRTFLVRYMEQLSSKQTQDLPPGCPGPGYSYDEHYNRWVKD